MTSRLLCTRLGGRLRLASRLVPLLVALLALLPPRGVAAQFPPDSFTNLRVLPEDIGQRELVGMMAGFTRALGVRCTYCHVGEEGQPLSAYDFPSDEKEPKRKARVMIEMLQHINGVALAELPARVEPRIEVQCITCHSGVTEPRTLQEVLLHAYDVAGLDSTLAAYHGLRDRYYGRAAYDFGEVPLVDVANDVRGRGSLADAIALHELNVEMNPDSRFARQQHAGAALLLAFQEGGTDAGVARYRELVETHGQQAFSPFALVQVGQALTRSDRPEEAVALYELTVAAYPELVVAHIALGDAYADTGQPERAIESYERALELDPDNPDAAEKLRALQRGG